jgi:hypothetical protein
MLPIAAALATLLLAVTPAIAAPCPLAGRLATIAASAPPPWTSAKNAEHPDDRAERLSTIARAIALESANPPEGWRWGPPELAALLLATTYEEGWMWRRDVHDGRKLGDNGRARCIAQLHRHPTWMPKDLWLASTGTDLESTRICVAGAARVMAHYSKVCVSEWRASSSLEVSFARVAAGYGTGKSCSPLASSERRARLAMRWLGELRR